MSVAYLSSTSWVVFHLNARPFLCVIRPRELTKLSKIRHFVSDREKQKLVEACKREVGSFEKCLGKLTSIPTL